MLVRILKSACGETITLKKGEVVDLPPIKAMGLISSGIAIAEKTVPERSILNLQEIETRLIKKDVQDSNTTDKRADNVSGSKATPKGRKRNV
jgi:hypothetical protein